MAMGGSAPTGRFLAQAQDSIRWSGVSVSSPSVWKRACGLPANGSATWSTGGFRLLSPVSVAHTCSNSRPATGAWALWVAGFVISAHKKTPSSIQVRLRTKRRRAKLRV